VEALKGAAVQRRLQVVAVPLGAPGELRAAPARPSAASAAAFLVAWGRTACSASILTHIPVRHLTAGVALSIPLSSWLLCESLIRWAGSWQQGEIDAAADTLQQAIIEAADSGGLHGQVRQHLPAAAQRRLPACHPAAKTQLSTPLAVLASQPDP
jgi:hypothetical protein